MEYLSQWLGEIKNELDVSSVRIIHDTLTANHFTSRLKLKLLNDEQLQVMFSGTNKLPLGTMAVLKFKLDQLKHESPLPVLAKGKRSERDISIEPKQEQKGQKALEFEKHRLQDELKSLNEELKELQVNLDSRKTAVRQPPPVGNSKQVCGHCHHRGHRNSASNPCGMCACTGYTYCGLKEKHPEYVSETNKVVIEIKKTKSKIHDKENQLKSLDEFETQSEHQFLKNMKPRLIALNKSYEQNKVLLMRHLRLLREECNGKIPPVTTNDSEQLRILLDKCTKKLKQTIGGEYKELEDSDSVMDAVHNEFSRNVGAKKFTLTSTNASNVNIFNSGVTVSPQSDQKKQEKSGSRSSSDSVSSESSDEEVSYRKYSSKRKKHQRIRRKGKAKKQIKYNPARDMTNVRHERIEEENCNNGLHFGPFQPHQVTNMPYSFYPVYGAPQMPMSFSYGAEYKGLSPFGMSNLTNIQAMHPAYTFPPNRFGMESYFGEPQPIQSGAFQRNAQLAEPVIEQNCHNNYVPVTSSTMNHDRQTVTLDTLVAAVELSEKNVNNSN